MAPAPLHACMQQVWADLDARRTSAQMVWYDGMQHVCVLLFPLFGPRLGVFGGRGAVDNVPSQRACSVTLCCTWHAACCMGLLSYAQPAHANQSIKLTLTSPRARMHDRVRRWA